MTGIEGDVTGMLGIGLTAVTGAVVINGVGNMLIKAAEEESKMFKKKKSTRSRKK